MQIVLYQRNFRLSLKEFTVALGYFVSDTNIMVTIAVIFPVYTYLNRMNNKISTLYRLSVIH